MFVKKGQNFRARLEGTHRQTLYKILDKKFRTTPSARYYFGDLICSRYDDMTNMKQNYGHGLNSNCDFGLCCAITIRAFCARIPTDSDP